MLNFNRRDRIGEPNEAAKPVLKPAIYEPPATAPASPPRAAEPAPAPASRSGPPPAPAAAAPGTGKASTPDAPESRLFVGVNIKLKGVAVSDCDALVIEGHVEATVHSKALEIAKPGTLQGTAEIEVAEIHGVFEGDLTARTRLVVHGTGRVSGTIRYGKLVVAEGGEITGDLQRLDAADATAAPAGAARPALSPSAERWSN
ncbi:MAG: polymer-forming cytoskeletal protein [Burkholderiales bacterium]